MNTANNDTPRLLAELSGLLRGIPGSTAPLANTLTVQAMGFETFGRTDALDLFARYPIAFSATPHVLTAPGALAAFDVMPDGRPIGVYADVVDGVIARLWVSGPVAEDAVTEPAVSVASDDFLTQDRAACAGDPNDHPWLNAQAWPEVLASAAHAMYSVNEQVAASSSNAVVVRAFSSGDAFAALYSLRMLSPGVPRLAHRRWVLAIGRIESDGALLHRRLAVSMPLPVPVPVLF